MTTKNRIATYAFAAAAAVGIASSAQAATYNNFDSATGTGTFGNDLVTPAGSFIDTFTFVLGREGDVSSTINSSASSGASNINFTRVRLTNADGFSEDYVPTSTGTFEFRRFGPELLAAGTYTLDVRGTTGGAASYAGNFTLAAVPEPAMWGMMIVGFGVAGSALRRRRVTTSVRFA